MIWLQLTANTGPAECCLGVRKALEALAVEAQRDGVVLDIVEEVAGPVPGTYRSVLLALEGSADAMLAARWCGSLQWICESPYRPGHKRKNWFLSGAAYDVTQAPEEVGEIRYEATRASGPGGQHVNKTDSAVRATHVATGLSVKVQAGRSQHANKRLAAQLIAAKLAGIGQEEADRDKAARRMQHLRPERGNAARVFVGPRFAER